MDPEQLTALYDLHAREILAFLVSRTSDPETAVDILAETFAVAFENRERFRGSHAESGRAWLYVIARNLAADHFRSEDTHTRAVARLGIQRRALTDTEYERIEELAATQQLRDLVAEHLEKLPHDQQLALRLRFVEEQPYAGIAALLGITQDAARARVSRGLRTIRAALNPVDSNATDERTFRHV